MPRLPLVVIALLLLAMPAGAQVTETQLTGTGSDRRPAWSPDGTTILFDSFSSGNPDLWSVPAAGGAATRLTFSRKTDLAPDWSPDGTMYAFASNQGGGSPNIYTRPAGGGTATLLDSDPGTTDGLPSWSPDMSQVAYVKGTNIYVVSSAGGGTPVQLTTDPGNDTHPTWSPDGLQIAFQSDRSGNIDVWVIPSAGGTATQITTDPANDGAPDWSPDGTELAIQSSRAGNNDIWVIPAAGGAATQITTDTASDIHPDWSPTGSEIVFSRNGGLWIATLSTGPAADLAVTKTVNDPTPAEADTVSYTVVVSNNGADDATGVDVTDLLPAGVTYVSDTATQGTYASGTGLWTVGAVNNGASATLTVTATVDAGTLGSTVSNTATVTASAVPDPNGSNDSDSADITVGGAADIAVAKTVDVSSPDEGSTVVYTVTATNNGPDPATGVEVTDLLPAGVTYVSDVASQGTYTSGTGLWVVGSVANGAAATLDITATVDAGTGGSTIGNTAAVTALDQPDPNGANDSATVNITPFLPADNAVQLTFHPNNDTMPTWSPDGTQIAWSSNRNGNSDVFVMSATGGTVTQLTFDPGNDEHPDWSEDGSTIAFDSDRANSWDIWTIPATGGTPFQVNTNPTNDRRPAWSRDGSTIAFDVNAGTLDIWTMPAGGGTPVQITTDPGWDTDPHYSPDGTTFVFDSDRTGSLHLFTTPTSGGGPDTQITFVPGPNFDPAWSPDGTMIAFASGRGASQDIWIMPANDESQAFQLTSGPGVDAIQTWSPDGSKIAFVSDRTGNKEIWVIDVPGVNPTVDLAVSKSIDNAAPAEADTVVYTVSVTNSGALDATGVEITDLLPAGVTYFSDMPAQGTYASGTGLWTVGGLTSGSSTTLDITATVDAGTFGQTITNTASVTALSETEGNSSNDIGSVNLTVGGGAVHRQITTNAVSDQRPSWSPDGTTIFFDSNRQGNRDLWTVPAAGGAASRFTFNGKFDGHPDHSPDGNFVVFSAVQNAGTDLYIRAVTGGPTILLLKDATTPDRYPAYSPDGTQIAFDKGGDIYLIAASGGTPTPLVTDTAVDGHPAWSPDGTQIAFSSDRSGNNDLWVIPAAGGTAMQLTFDPALDGEPEWSPDGTVIAFHSDRDGNGDIWVMPSAGGTPTKLSDDAGSDSQPTWSPDGLEVAFSRDGAIWALTVPTVPVPAALHLAAVEAPLESGPPVDLANLVDLEVLLSVDDVEPVEGGQVVFEVSAVNYSAAPATGVRVESLLPDGLRYARSSATSGRYDSASGLWSLESLGKEPQVLRITAEIDFGTADERIAGAARVRGVAQKDTDPTNDTDRVELTVGREIGAGEAGIAGLPTTYSLSNGRPNPFRNGTSFQFEIPQAGMTDLSVFDVTGRRVRTLLNRRTEAGRFDVDWDGRDEAGRRTAPGVYFVRLQSSDFGATRKAVRLE